MAECELIVRNRGKATWLAVAVAVATVTADMWLFTSTPGSFSAARLLAGIVAAIAIVLLCRRDRAAVGLTLNLCPSNGCWLKALLIVVGFYVSILFLELIVLAFVDVNLYSYDRYRAISSEDISTFFLWGNVIAPIHEELIYRLVLCVPLVATVGPRVTIVLGAAVFFGLHVVYGKTSPDIFLVGGIVIVWVYLKSGSIAPAIMLHAHIIR